MPSSLVVVPHWRTFENNVLQCGIPCVECGDQNQFLVIIILVLDLPGLTETQRTGSVVGLVQDVGGVPTSQEVVLQDATMLLVVSFPGADSPDMEKLAVWKATFAVIRMS